MATIHPALTPEMVVKVEGRIVKLAITGRGAPPGYELDYEKLDIVVAATIRVWCEVYRAVVTDSWKLPDDSISAEVKAKIDSSPDDPWCTVWNWDKPSITVHSWDNGQEALATAARTMAGLDLFSHYASRYGVEVLSWSQFTQAAPKPLETLQNANEGQATINIAKAFVRATKLGTAPNIIMLETKVGQSKKTAWVEALRADKRYHHKDIQYPPDTLVLFEIEPLAVVGDYQGARYLEIKERYGGNIRIYDRGGEHNYDWGSLMQHLNIKDTSGLVTGATIQIPAALLCMRCGMYKNDVQYKNYAGLYSVPVK